MTDHKDVPIEPQDYIYGVNVVDIGDLRVARGKSRRPHSSCKHLKMTYDTSERRIWCQDCETNVDAFDAFVSLVSWHSTAIDKLKARESKIKEAAAFSARSLAVKALDEVWRGRNMAPCCPHCKAGLLPEDFAKGIGSQVGRDYEMRRRGKK
jgi:hypothetical protein